MSENVTKQKGGLCEGGEEWAKDTLMGEASVQVSATMVGEKVGRFTAAWIVRRRGPESEDFFTCAWCGKHIDWTRDKRVANCYCGGTTWWCGEDPPGMLTERQEEIKRETLAILRSHGVIESDLSREWNFLRGSGITDEEIPVVAAQWGPGLARFLAEERQQTKRGERGGVDG